MVVCEVDGRYINYLSTYAPPFTDTSIVICKTRRQIYMKATGIVRRVDDLGRIVIPKEIRRTLRIREGDSSRTTLTPWQIFSFAMLDLSKRNLWNGTY